jgi:hypothetical protein
MDHWFENPPKNGLHDNEETLINFFDLAPLKN